MAAHSGDVTAERIGTYGLEIFFTVVTFLGMAKLQAISESVSAERLSSICEELEQLATTLRRCEAVARNQATKSLAIYYLKSAVSGLDRVASFVDSADKSRRQAVMGKPLEAGQSKPRSNAEKLAKQRKQDATDDAQQAETLQQLAEQRRRSDATGTQDQAASPIRPVPRNPRRSPKRD